MITNWFTCVHAALATSAKLHVSCTVTEPCPVIISAFVPLPQLCSMTDSQEPFHVDITTANSKHADTEEDDYRVEEKPCKSELLRKAYVTWPFSKLE